MFVNSARSTRVSDRSTTVIAVPSNAQMTSRTVGGNQNSRSERQSREECSRTSSSAVHPVVSTRVRRQLPAKKNGGITRSPAGGTAFDLE
jgi:hypothetical protein